MAKFYLLKRFCQVALLLMLSLSAFAQQKNVTGRVTSKEDGSPIPGVNVLEKGTSNGTATDADGRFSISTNDGATITFSFIGYTTQEVAVGNLSTIDIVLETDVTALTEVVVVGYGQQEKKDVTGVVAAVDSKDFNRGAIVSPDQLMIGKVAGVQMVPGDGTPGGGAAIRIRGGTSLNASNEPLYVIDGFPVDNGGTAAGSSPLNFINPNDIETFTVLKDASAAAIYGSRAANGVIIITTKKGKSGAPTITYDGYVSQAEVARKYDVFNADQFRSIVTAYKPASLHYLGDPGAEDPANRAYNTNWQDQIFHKAVGQSHNITMTGGAEKNSYRISVGHQDIGGIIRTSYTKRTTFGASFTQKMLDDNLTIDINVKGAQTEDRFAPGVIGAAIAMDPTHPVYDALSPFGGYFENYDLTGNKRFPVQLSVSNPVSMLNQTNDLAQNFRALGNVQFDYKIKQVPGLRFNLNLGSDITRGSRNFFAPSTLRSQVTPDSGRVQVQRPIKHSELLEFYGNYTRDLGNAGKLDFTGGYSYQKFYFENQGFTSTRLATNIYGANNPAVAKQTIPFNPGIAENWLISFFGRVNYSLKDKYLFTANLRDDGSTRFGGGKRHGLFPSAAFGWRIINEGFMANAQDFFSDLKLRVGYGVTGNQDFANYKFLASYTAGDVNAQYPFGGNYYTTIRPGAYNPNIQWEQTSSLNVGVDFGIFGGRLNGSIDVYDKETTKLIFTKPLAPGSNLSNSVESNIGQMSNKGIELSLNTVAVNSGGIRWDIGFNASYNQNKIKKLDGNSDPNYQGLPAGFISGGVGNTVQTIKVGETVNSFLVYEHKNGPDGHPVADRQDGSVPQLDMYVDRNNDGIINEKDKRVFHASMPKVIMGFTSNLTYHDFDLAFTLRANLGGFNYNNMQSSSTFQNAADAFRPVNMITQALATNYYTPQYWSDYYVQNASFLRMDNITLGYSVKQVKSAKVRIYATVQNAFVLTKYAGLDPETNIGTGTSGSPGIDNNAYPRARTYTLGIRVGL